MKRLFAILLALMLVIGMVGCGQDATTPTETTAPTVETTAPTTEPVITDIPVVITDLYAVYVIGIPTNEPTYGTTVSFRLENLSPYELTFDISNFVLNGEWEFETVRPVKIVGIGHKQNVDVLFHATDLAQAKIDVINTLEFNLDITRIADDGTQDYLNGDVTEPYVITFTPVAE